MTPQKEYWKHVDGLPIGYEVSSLGQVRVDYGNGEYKPIKLSVSDGYYTFNVLGEQYAVHRLVARAFLPNPNNYELVEHQDRNRKNNCVTNLQWTTRSKNVLQSYAVGQISGKQIRCVEDNIIFATLSSAEAFYGIPRLVIEESIKSNHICFGYHFEYVQESIHPVDMMFLSIRDLINGSKSYDSIDAYREAVIEEYNRNVVDSE